MASAGVVGPLVSEIDYPRLYVVLAFALLAEPVSLELEGDGVGEGIVTTGDVDIVMGEIGKVEYPGADVMPRDPTDGAVLVVESPPGLVPRPCTARM